jgi:plasmid stabilization system protein ParE
VAQLSWSLTALDSLDAIADYIERDSPLYAATLVQRVFDASRTLASFPRMGRVVPEFQDETLRELVFQGYRIVYWIDGDEVRVILVLHSARDLRQELPDEPWSLR